MKQLDQDMNFAISCHAIHIHEMTDYTGKLQLSLSLEKYKKDICYVIGILYPEPLKLARCYETE